VGSDRLFILFPHPCSHTFQKCSKSTVSSEKKYRVSRKFPLIELALFQPKYYCLPPPPDIFFLTFKRIERTEARERDNNNHNHKKEKLLARPKKWEKLDWRPYNLRSIFRLKIYN
jgi:hypothetical protein